MQDLLHSRCRLRQPMVFYLLWSLQTGTSIHQEVKNFFKVTPGLCVCPAGRGTVLEARHNPRAGSLHCVGFSILIAMEFIAPEAALLPQFAGLIASAAGMLAGTLASRH
jgi:SSS family solute:Na+ symporter